MAAIIKRGKSYRIVVSCGYDSKGNKLPPETMTWKPGPGMTEKQIKKELAKIADDFEEKVKNGLYLAGEKITLAEFAEIWFENYAKQNLKPKTQQEYKALLNNRILPALGHHVLARINPALLVKFQTALQEPGQNMIVKYRAKPGINEIWKASDLKEAAVKIERHTFKSMLEGKNINLSTAEKFATAVQLPVTQLFEVASAPKKLSANSVQHHMRCISTILSTAVEWQMIVANPCERVKPPKIVRKKIKFLEIEEAKSLIEAATKLDDMRVKTAVLLFLYSGIRKGELAGLQWNSDVDLENSVITVNRTLQYIDKIGLVIGPPKTEEGEREITISSNLVDYLKSYKIWQIQERLKVGDQWQKGDREKWLSEGTEHDPHEPKDWQPVDWMFTNWRGYPLHPSTIYHWIKDFLKENNHPLMTVHGLRHTNISLMLAEGVDLITASKRAGHAKPSTTADIYAHALKKPDRAAAEKLNTLLSSHKKKSG